MIIFSQTASQIPSQISDESSSNASSETENLRALTIAAEIAQILGNLVYPIAFSGADFTPLLETVPHQPALTAGIWLALPPSLDRYIAFYQAAIGKNIKLFNTPAQHKLVRNQKTSPQPKDLRYAQTAPDGSPLGRIFRVFLYRQIILTYGYFWNVDDPLRWLSVQDEEQIAAIALTAAQQIDVPFLAIDVGQQANQTWQVVGLCDAQFAGTQQIPWLHLWSELKPLV
jgi:ATP-grasp domain, R2K clade family 3